MWIQGRIIVICLFCAAAVSGQSSNLPAASKTADPFSASIPLTVDKGTPLRVALEKEVDIGLGKRVDARVVESVYAFDRVVIPAGSEVAGKITKIDGPSKGQRTEAILRGDLTPLHRAEIEFDELVLPDGRRLRIQTAVSPGIAQVVHLMAGGEKESTKKDATARKLQEARDEIHREWNAAAQTVKAPGKFHRLERFAVSRLPYHPQYLEPGTRYDAELEAPLDFGTETVAADALSGLGGAPPAGSMVHAILVTPLSSANNRRDDRVEAVLMEPLFSEDHRLLLPQGSRLEGDVVQVRAARRMSRNGQIRFVFHKLELENAVEQEIDANLQGVEADREENLKLDEEGGAHSTSAKTRYLSTAIAIALAASTAAPDREEGGVQSGGDSGGHALAGASGFNLIGTLIGVAARSRPVATGFGAYGAGRSIYAHFLARGHDVVFPKNTRMEISFGATRPAGAKPAPSKTPAISPQ